MEILTKINLLVITIILSTLFTGNVVAKTYPEYNIGEKITYNNMDFYVIASSDDKSDSVTLLKSEPLTTSEVNKYGFGHINKYTFSNEGVAINYNGYGGMAYYSSETCGYIEFIYPGVVYNYESSDGCAVDYKLSDIKYIIDAWAIDKFAVNDLTEDRLGHKTRLITTLELIDNLGCSFNNCNQSPYKILDIQY